MVKSFIIFRDQFYYNLQYNYGLYGILIIPPHIRLLCCCVLFLAEYVPTGKKFLMSLRTETDAAAQLHQKLPIKLKNIAWTAHKDRFSLNVRLLSSFP